MYIVYIIYTLYFIHNIRVSNEERTVILYPQGSLRLRMSGATKSQLAM